MTAPTWARVDIEALRHNLAAVRRAAPASRVLAVVKADGYGHGLMTVVQALREASDGFALTYTEEAAQLRAAGVAKPIVLLQGFVDEADLNEAARLRLDLTVHHEQQLRLLESSRLPAPVRVWLKVDSGMHRLGFPLRRVVEVYHRVCAAPCVAGVRLMTHLANADDPHDPSTLEQLHGFFAVSRRLGAEQSIANSAGVLAWPDSHTHWVRPGVMLYGASPFAAGNADSLGLRPVMTLCSRLIAINEQPKGAPIGYGATWRCPHAMPIGVVAAGYGDGYPRHAPNGTPVLVDGQRVPLVGRVSMDLITVDLRSYPGARIGDPVVLWGCGLPVEEVARRAGTIAYELLARVTRRVARHVQPAPDDGG